MKASQLIKELQELVDEHGDQDVRYDCDIHEDQMVSDVVIYESFGDIGSPSCVVEFYLQ